MVIEGKCTMSGDGFANNQRDVSGKNLPDYPNGIQHFVSPGVEIQAPLMTIQTRTGVGI